MAAPVDGVPVNGVVECVVKNAMEKLMEKQQDLRSGPPSRRKLQLARFLEETRRQFISVLALVRWQKGRLAITRQCEDLVDSLQLHGYHMTTVSERLSYSAEELAHTHRTPMYDVRTAVDVLATGTYSMLPKLNTRQILPPQAAEDSCEEGEIERHLDFLLRSQLLNTKIPSGLSSVHVSGGKLTLTCDGEFELVLSLKLDHPGKPWRVEHVGILVRAAGTDDPTTDVLAARLESRMAVVEHPLVEAFSILTECCRLRTWQIILNQQAYSSTSGPRLSIDTIAGNSFTVHYWPDSYVLTFESLLLGKDQASDNAVDCALLRHPSPHIILMMHAQGISRVQIQHRPQLVGADGRPLQLSLNRDDLNFELLIQTAIAEHSKCRLRVLLRALMQKEEMLASLDITAAIGLAFEEVVVSVDGKARLSFVVDTRNGEFSVRDMDAHTQSGSGIAALLEGLSNGVEGAADALMKWRSQDMLNALIGLLPLYGITASSSLLAYSRAQSWRLSEITKDKPALFLQLPGDNMIDSGFVDNTRSVPRPSAQDIYAMAVTCDATTRTYKYTLIILSIHKDKQAYTEDVVVPEDQWEDRGALRAADAERYVARELDLVITLAFRRVHMFKLCSQLDSQNIPYRDVGGVILFRLGLEPLVTRELKLKLDDEVRGVSMGGLSCFTVHIALTAMPFRGEYKDPKAVLDLAVEDEFLESCVRMDGGGKVLVVKMSSVHSNSIQQFRQVVEGVVNVGKLGLELERLLVGEGSEAFLADAVEIEAMSYTAVVLRFKDSGELVTFRYKIKTGFEVVCKSYPFVSQVAAALNHSLDVAGALTALVKFKPVLAALKALKCCEGDYTYLPYTLTGFGVLYRGTFGVHFRILADDSNAYSISDMCPHSSQKPLPANMDSTFMGHATDTAAPVSSMVDTLWAIPHWSQVIHSLCETANVKAMSPGEASAGGGGATSGNLRGGDKAALSHINAHRYAAVCSSEQLGIAISMVHRHLAASHLKIFGYHFLSKVTAKASTTTADGKRVLFVKGHHAVTLQVLSPQTMVGREDRLLVTFEQIDPKAIPSSTADVLSDSDVQVLQTLFQTQVSAPPYAANHMKSYIQLLSAPVSALRSFCDLLRELVSHESYVDFALAPAFLITWSETKDKPASSYKGPAIILPRTDGACAILHTEREEKISFVLRLWHAGSPVLEVCFVYAYSQHKLYLGSTNPLSTHPWTATAVASILNKMSTPLQVPTGSLWSPVKMVLSVVQAAAPPQEPSYIQI